MEQYNMHLPSAVYGGMGSLVRVCDVARGHKKAVLFTDKGVCGAGLIDKPIELLKKAGLAVEIFDDLATEPTVDQAEAVIERFRASGADLIVAIGGGSIIDVAKLASVLDTDDYTIRDLLKDPVIAQKQTKTLMIPTTAGTGSEATPNSIVTVPEEELKIGIVNDEQMADSVILDADMIKLLPKPIAAATGIDALCHSLECYTGSKANPFSDTFAMEGMRLIFANIEAACEPGGDSNAKQAMLTASFYGGIAISAAGTTAVHALAYPLGGKYHIAHGVSNAMMLSPVMRFNEDSIRDRLAEIHDNIGMVSDGGVAEKSASLLERIYKLVKDLDIPTSLIRYGVGPDDLEALVENGMKVTRLLVNNVKKVTADDARIIYSQLLRA